MLLTMIIIVFALCLDVRVVVGVVVVADRFVVVVDDVGGVVVVATRRYAKPLELTTTFTIPMLHDFPYIHHLLTTRTRCASMDVVPARRSLFY